MHLAKIMMWYRTVGAEWGGCEGGAGGGVHVPLPRHPAGVGQGGEQDQVNSVSQFCSPTTVWLLSVWSGEKNAAAYVSQLSGDTKDTIDHQN